MTTLREPRRATHFKGQHGPASKRKIRTFEQTHPRIKCCCGEMRHRRRCGYPRQGSFIEPHVPLPAMHPNYMQVSTECVFRVHVARQLAKRHPVTHRDIDDTHERLEPWRNRSAFDETPGDWVGTIQHEDGLACFASATQNIE